MAGTHARIARGAWRRVYLENEALACSIEQGLSIAVRPRHREGERRGAVVEDIVGRRVVCCTHTPRMGTKMDIRAWTDPKSTFRSDEACQSWHSGLWRAHVIT